MFIKLFDWIYRIFQPTRLEFESPSDMEIVDYNQYDLSSGNWDQAFYILVETQQRLDRVIEINEELYERSARLAARSQRFRTNQ